MISYRRDLIGLMTQQITPRNLFEFDVTDGVMQNKLTGGRAFIFGSSAWRSMREDLKGIYGPLGVAITEQMGQSYGKSLGNIGKKWHMDLRAFFETMVKLGSKTGWGSLSLSGGDPLTGRALLRLENCVFCTEEAGKEERLCEFFAGVVRGAADEITGKSHSVVETQCAGAGARYCEFYLDRMDPEDETRY